MKNNSAKIRDLLLFLLLECIFLLYPTSCQYDQTKMNEILRFLQEENNDANIFTFPINGSTVMGYYYTTLYIGTPPQRQTLIIDTGSHITSLPCTGNNCGEHLDSHFNITASSTARIINCMDHLDKFTCSSCEQSRCIFRTSYVEESSISGFFIEDSVKLSNTDMILNKTSELAKLNKTIGFAFGCTTSESGMFKSQKADGIMGLSRYSDNSNHMPHIVDYLHNSPFHEKNAFSICLGNKGGFFSIGGENRLNHLKDHETKSVPLKDSGNSQYKFTVKSMKIGDEILPLSSSDFDMGQGSFWDTGTTLFYSHDKINRAIKKALDNYCEESADNCDGDFEKEDGCFIYDPKYYDSHYDFLLTFPVIEFGLENKNDFKWYPNEYLYRIFEDEKEKFCLPFETIDDRVIFGAVTMKNYDFAFDREKNVFNYTRADCSPDHILKKMNERNNSTNTTDSANTATANTSNPLANASSPANTTNATNPAKDPGSNNNTISSNASPNSNANGTNDPFNKMNESSQSNSSNTSSSENSKSTSSSETSKNSSEASNDTSNLGKSNDTAPSASDNKINATSETSNQSGIASSQNTSSINSSNSNTSNSSEKLPSIAQPSDNLNASESSLNSSFLNTKSGNSSNLTASNSSNSSEHTVNTSNATDQTDILKVKKNESRIDDKNNIVKLEKEIDEIKLGFVFILLSFMLIIIIIIVLIILFIRRRSSKERQRLVRVGKSDDVNVEIIDPSTNVQNKKGKYQSVNKNDIGQGNFQELVENKKFDDFFEGTKERVDTNQFVENFENLKLENIELYSGKPRKSGMEKS